MNRAMIAVLAAALVLATSAVTFASVGAPPAPEGMMGIMMVGAEPAEEDMAVITSETVSGEEVPVRENKQTKENTQNRRYLGIDLSMAWEMPSMLPLLPILLAFGVVVIRRRLSSRPM